MGYGARRTVLDERNASLRRGFAAFGSLEAVCMMGIEQFESKKNMKTLSGLVRLLFLFVSVAAAGQDSLLLETLEANRKTFQLENGLLQGSGADFFQRAAEENQFFLIGENHGLAEIPQFTAALYGLISRESYTYFATETGPYTAAMLQQLTHRAEFLSDLKQLLAQYPWSIPFYGWKEEAQMLDDIVGDRNPGEPVIWGLDQEFAGSPRLLLPELVGMISNETGKSVVQKYAEKAQAGFEETLQTGNPSPMFFYQATTDDFEQLRKAVGEDERAEQLLDELEESWEIYQQFFTRQGYASNRQRAEMMKRHFLAYYRAAVRSDSLPKVLIKLGSNHVYRGANSLNVFDIGNFVSEFASVQGTGSFHLYVIGKKGTQNAYNPFTDESAKQQPYDAESYLDHIDIDPFLSLSREDAWSVFDLRPLRSLLFNKKIKDIDPALEKLIWSYDAFLVIPEVHAARLLSDE